MLCEFIKAKNGWCFCSRPGCGNRLKSNDPSRCFAECKATNGLGDVIARWLDRGWIIPFVSVTPASYRRWKVRCGLADACNCGERKEEDQRFRAMGEEAAREVERLETLVGISEVVKQ